MTENPIALPDPKWTVLAQRYLKDAALAVLSETIDNFDNLSEDDTKKALALVPDVVNHLAALIVPLEIFLQYLALKTKQAAEQSLIREEHTEAEFNALVVERQLDGINSVQLEAGLVLGKALNESEATGSWGAHPEVASLYELVEKSGLSQSESSDFQAIQGFIFPWLETMGLDPRQVWHDVGKSKFRRLVPLFRAMFNPAAAHPGVHRQMEEIRDRLEETTGKEMTDDELGLYLIGEATTLSVRHLRQALDGDRDLIAFMGTQRGDHVDIKSEMDLDQLGTLKKRMHLHAEFYIEREPDLEVHNATVSSVPRARETEKEE